jgi:hypothetical protein
MRQPALPLLMGAPKTVSGLAIVFLVTAACFGFLNSQKVKTLRADVANAHAARDAAERREAHEKLNASAGATSGPDEDSKITEAENRTAKAEAQLAQIQKEKADLQGTLAASQQEVGSLQKRLEQMAKTSNPSLATSADTSQTTDLQSQVDDLRRQLDGAEKEKALLAGKLEEAQERKNQPREGKKRRETVSSQRETASIHRTGVRGAVLAYNQAYNFAVLNLGARNGVETNSEMLVLRDGTLIGKIRISSVEPATAIGDIITSSLARGVQVQPGDIVIYAGTNP